MKKTLVAVLFVLMAMGMGSFASADHHVTEGTLWTLHGYYIEPTIDGIIPFNDDLDAGFYGGGKIGYQFNDNLSIEIETAWSEFDIAEHGGKLTIIPLLFNLRYNIFPGRYIVDPYVFGGLGVSFNDVDDESVELDNSFAGQIGGGVEYHINEYLSAYLNVSFLITNADAKAGFLGEEDVELNSVILGGGVVWRF